MNEEIPIYTIMSNGDIATIYQYIKDNLPNIKTTPNKFIVHIYYNQFSKGIIFSYFIGMIRALNWNENHTYKITYDNEKIICVVRRVERMQTHNLKVIRLGPSIVIRKISIRVKCKGDINNPKTNPKMDFPAGVTHIDGNGNTRKRSLILTYKEGKLFWKNAPFKALNSEEIEKQIAEALNE